MSKYAKRMKTMEEPANIIKGLFGAMNDPDVISFGGGAIAKECLPVDEVREITNQIMREMCIRDSLIAPIIFFRMISRPSFIMIRSVLSPT